METNTTSNSFVNRKYVPASPTASAFITYGQTSTNNFTGTANINVPLYNFGFRDIALPLNLSYQHGNGVKPDIVPGTVGNGWLLSSGGVISRISKGILPVSFPNPSQVDATTNLTVSPDWSSTAKMQAAIAGPKYLTNAYCQYDEFSFSFYGLSGKFYTDLSGKQRFTSAEGEDLKVEMEVVQQKVITLPLEPQILPQTPVIPPYVNITTLQQSPYKFTITDSKGTKYVFGGTDESIELIRSGRSVQGSPVVIEDYLGMNTEAISWYLTSITSPNGDVISFVYQRGRFYVNSTSYVKSLFLQFGNNAMAGVPTARLVSSTLTNPCYLKKIITPESVVQFYWSPANVQLSKKIAVNTDLSLTSYIPSWNPDPYFCDVHFHGYQDVARASVDDRFPDKVDYFTISDNAGALTKKVVFNYSNNIGTRLKLTSVEIRGSDDKLNTAQVYSFEYNSQSLPDYLSFAKDTYGYYNGQNTHIISDNPSDYYTNFQNASWRSAYIASRAPNSAYAQAEILQKVTYPTGGFTTYEYESHYYGRTAQNWPASVTENPSGASQTGGLRIKTITNYDAIGHKAGQKRYYYIKNYTYTGGAQTSSGVLNYVPQFWEFYSGSVGPPASPPYGGTFPNTINYKTWGSDPINPMDYNKTTHITYSEVTEVDLDRGYTVYKYKNYDNGYADIAALNAVYDNKEVSNLWKEDNVNSLELERGQMLSSETYNSLNVRNSATTFEYFDDPARLTDDGKNIRILKCIPNNISSTTFHLSLRYVATLVYTYYPYLKKKTKVSYESTGSVSEWTTYSYNNSERLLSAQVTTNSNGDAFRLITKYPKDLVAAGVSVPYQSMVSKHIINPVVISQQYKDPSTLLATTTINYRNWSGDFFGPETIQWQKPPNAVQTTAQFYSYDASGNVLEQSKSNDVHHSYLWGYNRTYPIAQVVNARANEIFYEGFEGGAIWPNVVGGWPDMAVDKNKTHSGRYSGKIYNPNSYILYYHSHQWLQISLSAPTKYKYSGWFFSDGPQIALYLFMKRAGETGYLTYVDATTTTNSGKWIYLEKEFEVPADVVQLNVRVDNYGGGSVWFDDIRLHPSLAKMTTYTYDPLIGVTSQSDINSRPSYYEYDAFGRLYIVRDQDNNIIKKICYNYAGQPNTCAIYGNQQQSQTFTKYCSSGVGSQVPYSVNANTYTAGTQADANTLALNDIAANGQNYANQNGTCTIPPPVNITVNGNNYTAAAYYVQFLDVVSNQSYTMYVPGGSSAQLTMLSGTYKVTFSPGGTALNTTFRVNGYSTYGTTAVFNNISISTGTQVVIGY